MLRSVMYHIRDILPDDIRHHWVSDLSARLLLQFVCLGDSHAVSGWHVLSVHGHGCRCTVPSRVVQLIDRPNECVCVLAVSVGGILLVGGA
jgi:hypothetical protein